MNEVNQISSGENRGRSRAIGEERELPAEGSFQRGKSRNKKAIRQGQRRRGRRQHRQLPQIAKQAMPGCAAIVMARLIRIHRGDIPRHRHLDCAEGGTDFDKIIFGRERENRRKSRPERQKQCCRQSKKPGAAKACAFASHGRMFTARRIFLQEDIHAFVCRIC